MEAVSGEFAISIDLAERPGDGGSSPMRELTGAVLGGHLELLDVVGGGGMGTVYRARDTRADRDVAVKVLDPRFDPAKDPSSRERFLREARLSTRLAHGNIVEVFETGETDGVHFIAMELLHGRTLSQLLEAEGALHWPRALGFIRQMGAGLAFAHELGLVHRDLKPANCFVLGEGDDEFVKLLDFGLAKPVMSSGAGDDEVTRTSVVMGSPTYMAPEQARGEASVQSDIYALGVMLFRMLAGQPPFTGRTAVEVIVNHIQARLPWLEELGAAPVPLAVELLLRRCLEKDPKARFHSVQALLAALDEAEADARRDPLRRAATTQLPALAPTPTPMPVLTPQAAPPIDDAPLAARTPTVMFQAVRAPTRSTPWPVVLALVLVAGGGGYLAWRANEASAASKPAEQAPATAPTTPAPTTPAPTTPAPTAAVAAPVPVVAPAPGGPVLFRINSIPTGATVKVGTKVVGQTPTTFPMDPDEGGEATAELTLELKGYQTITFIATSPGPRFDLVQRLQKGAGRVSLPALVAPRDEEVKAAAVEEDVPAVPVPVQVPTLPQVAVPVPQQAPVAARVAGAPVPGDELTTRPRLLSGAAPRYSESARVAKVEGTAIARCVVTARGRLDRCRMLKSVPLMDEAVLESLLTRVYEPGRVGADAVDSELNIVVKISR